MEICSRLHALSNGCVRDPSARRARFAGSRYCFRMRARINSTPKLAVRAARFIGAPLRGPSARAWKPALKLQHWRGVPGIFAPITAPMLEFVCFSLWCDIEIQRSSNGAAMRLTRHELATPPKWTSPNSVARGACVFTAARSGYNRLAPTRFWTHALPRLPAVRFLADDDSRWFVDLKHHALRRDDA